jgi:hypothetical protein
MISYSRLDVGKKCFKIGRLSLIRTMSAVKWDGTSELIVLIKDMRGSGC